MREVPLPLRRGLGEASARVRVFNFNLHSCQRAGCGSAHIVSVVNRLRTGRELYDFCTLLYKNHTVVLYVLSVSV